MKSFKIVWMAILIIGSIAHAQENVVVCVPAPWVSKLSGLDCYYDFGYQTTDNKFCYARFDTSTADTQIVKATDSRLRSNGNQPINFIPAHYDGNCTLCYPSDTRIWFSGNNNSLTTDQIAQISKPGLTAGAFANAVNSAAQLLDNLGSAPSDAIAAFGSVSRCPCPLPSAANPTSGYATMMGFYKQKKTASTAASPTGGTCNPAAQ